MGTCCAAHLAAMIQPLAPNAQNRAVTVKIVENLFLGDTCHDCGGPVAINPEVMRKGFACSGYHYAKIVCDYCNAPAEFEVSYYQKKEIAPAVASLICDQYAGKKLLK